MFQVSFSSSIQKVGLSDERPCRLIHLLGAAVRLSFVLTYRLHLAIDPSLVPAHLMRSHTLIYRASEAFIEAFGVRNIRPYKNYHENKSSLRRIHPGG